MENKNISISKKSKIIGFRPTARQLFEMDNICQELQITRSTLIRFILEDFIDKYETSKGYE